MILGILGALMARFLGFWGGFGCLGGFWAFFGELGGGFLGFSRGSEWDLGRVLGFFGEDFGGFLTQILGGFGVGTHQGPPGRSEIWGRVCSCSNDN